MNEHLKLAIYITLLVLGLIYVTHFLAVNAEAIAWNAGNHCITLPLNFGACT
jgi:hypothetical protein